MLLLMQNNKLGGFDKKKQWLSSEYINEWNI